MPELTSFSDIPDIANAITHRKASPVELVRDVLDAVARHNSTLNAYITVCADTALAAAAKLEKAVAQKKQVGPLAGVPISVKDLVRTIDAPTTAGSRMFGDGLPPDEDATVVRRLRKLGAIVVGKANLHEVALGVTSENEHFGPARNPWNAEFVAGGSSGGSASSVAAGFCTASVGTDTRGSIRIPASACGVTGFKPTYGLLPVDGVIPLSPALDHVGPITHTVTDAAWMLGAMTGNKVTFERFVKALRMSTRSLVIGISEFHLRDIDDDIVRAFEKALKVLSPLCREIRDVSIEGIEGVQEASAVITSSEAYAYHAATLKKDPKSYGTHLRKRLEEGVKRTPAELAKAMEKREEVRQAFAKTFTEVDILIGATLPTVPPRIGEQEVQVNGKGERVVDAFTRLNGPQNMAGVPAMTVPCGLSKGLPIGLQFIAAEGKDDVLISIGAAFQRETHWHQRRPPIAR
ncbi:MAG: amidase [Gemmatimonadaceae bacterium]